MHDDKYDFQTQVGPEGMAAGLQFTRAHAVHREIDDLALFDCTVVGLQTGDVVFRQPRWIDCLFERPDFTATTFVGGYFRGVRFVGPSFRSTVFDRCVFEDCDFGLSAGELPGPEALVFRRSLFAKAGLSEKVLRQAELVSEDCRFLTEKKATTPVARIAPSDAKPTTAAVPAAITTPVVAAEPGRFSSLER